MNTKKQTSTANTAETNLNPNLRNIRTTGREYVNPVDYRHPYDFMATFAQWLACS